jgi:hypothetical protein
MSQDENKPEKSIEFHVVEGRPAFRVYKGFSKEELAELLEKEEAEKKAAREAQNGD